MNITFYDTMIGKKLFWKKSKKLLTKYGNDIIIQIS